MDLDALNTEQQLAVTCSDGPVCVLAGAGSGKTRVLTYRLIYLMETYTTPSRLLAMTFTKKAAQEMSNRLSALLGKRTDATLPHITTIHAFCLSVLHKYVALSRYLRPDFKVVTTYEYLNKSYNAFNIRPEDPKRRDFMKYMQREKMQKHLPSQANTNIPIFREIYRHFQESLIANNILVYDDMLFYTVLLFDEHPEVAKYYQDKFDYVLVDEYQDTSPLQMEILSTLTERTRNLYVVGDNDQAIYGFKGADMKIILDFQKTYPEAQLFKLQRNYRSIPNIIASANAVISNNINRFDKTLYTTTQSEEKVHITEYFTAQQEAYAIANQLLALHNEYSYNDIAIIIRNNYLSNLFEVAFRNRHIPYMVWGDKSFFEREEVLDIMAYLSLLYDSNDFAAFDRIANKPSRFIGTITKNAVIDYCRSNNFSLEEGLRDHINDIVTTFSFKSSQHNALIRFFTLYKKAVKHVASQNSIIDMIDYIMQDMQYETHILTFNEQETRQEKYSNIWTIKRLAKTFYQEGHSSLKDFISYFYYLKNAEELSTERVRIMTIHKSKGLEFPVVYIPSLVDNIFPSKEAKYAFNAHNDQLMEEERRLFYVALTRAKTKLFISSYAFRTSKKRERPSRFISEIPAAYCIKTKDEDLIAYNKNSPTL